MWEQVFDRSVQNAIQQTNLYILPDSMARPRAFDEQDVIDKAVDVFWRKGYANTSIGDLERVLGMGRQSIYNTFGDKRALFVRALQNYQQNGSNNLTSLFNGEMRGVEVIHGYFEILVETITLSDDKRGCFLTKCLMEQGVDDPDVASQCQSNEHTLTSAFKKALQEAVEDQSVPPSLDVDAAASMLSTQVYGLSVMARSGAPKETLLNSAKTLLDMLVR